MNNGIRHPWRWTRFLGCILAAVAIAASSPAVDAQQETVRGVVTDGAGNPLAGVEVVLRSTGDGEPIERQVTDRDGSFRLSADQVRPGRQVALHLDGFNDVVLEITPQHLVVATLELTMHRSVTVDPEAAPPQNAPPAAPSYSSDPTTEQRKRAISIYNDAVKQYEKGTKDKTESNKEAAIQKLREAAAIDPTFAEPHRLLARIALKQKNWAEAARYAEDLLRIDPNDTEGARILYLGMVVTRNHFRVGDAAKRLARLEPESVASIEEHAQTFYANGVYPMARALYEALVEISDDPAAAYLNLGICSDALGDVEGTRAAFESFLELVPNDNPDVAMVRERLSALP